MSEFNFKPGAKIRRSAWQTGAHVTVTAVGQGMFLGQHSEDARYETPWTQYGAWELFQETYDFPFEVGAVIDLAGRDLGPVTITDAGRPTDRNFLARDRNGSVTSHTKDPSPIHSTGSRAWKRVQREYRVVTEHRPPKAYEAFVFNHAVITSSCDRIDDRDVIVEVHPL